MTEEQKIVWDKLKHVKKPNLVSPGVYVVERDTTRCVMYHPVLDSLVGKKND